VSAVNCIAGRVCSKKESSVSSSTQCGYDDLNN